jgi:hypothetical protein
MSLAKVADLTGVRGKLMENPRGRELHAAAMRQREEIGKWAMGEGVLRHEEIGQYKYYLRGIDAVANRFGRMCRALGISDGVDGFERGDSYEITKHFLGWSTAYNLSIRGYFACAAAQINRALLTAKLIERVCVGANINRANCPELSVRALGEGARFLYRGLVSATEDLQREYAPYGPFVSHYVFEPRLFSEPVFDDIVTAILAPIFGLPLKHEEGPRP